MPRCVSRRKTATPTSESAAVGPPPAVTTSPSCSRVFPARLCGEEKGNGEMESAEMIACGWRSLKYPPLLIVRTIKRWEREIHKYCATRAAMDLMITYMAAGPFNSNHVVTKRLNRTVTTIGLSKNKIIPVPKVYSNRNPHQPLTYQRLLIIVRAGGNLASRTDIRTKDTPR